MLFLVIIPTTRAQNKLLTIDDLFDPQKRVNFRNVVAFEFHDSNKREGSHSHPASAG